jgi:hypothetical protein
MSPNHDFYSSPTQFKVGVVVFFFTDVSGPVDKFESTLEVVELEHSLDVVVGYQVPVIVNLFHVRFNF